jgi:hypothetical protein
LTGVVEYIKIMSTKKTSPVNPTRTPVVEFEYPDRDTNRMKVRYVRVVQADSDYIKGYELENAFSTKEGQFKAYCRSRIVRNGVALVTF